VAVPTLRALLGLLVSSWRTATNPDAARAGEEQPLRAELYSVDQLAQHAATLAISHRLARARGPDQLIPRLDENERILSQTHHLVAAAVARHRRIAPAGEWLLDNFYLIEDQIRLTRRNLPRSYSRDLPRLASGPHAGCPRAYAIALELIAHVDGRIDLDSLDSFVAAYKPSHALHLGELWAIPIMLGLALIENLRRVAARLAAGRRDRDRADDWAERMIAVVERNPSDLVLVLADMARADPPLTGAFLSELTRHLQGQSVHFTFANSWLEHRLSEHGLTTDRLIQTEGQAQAADQISMGNCITSLRFLGANDWREFVETHSAVEQTLRQDPAGIYASMDFKTRDRYRHGIEEIARRSALEEDQIAREAIALARAAAAVTEAVDRTDLAAAPTADSTGCADAAVAARASHVGYYLIDRGRRALELRGKMRLSWWTAIRRLARRRSLFLYGLSVCAVTVGATAAFVHLFLRPSSSGAPPFWSEPPLTWVALVPPLALGATHLGVAFTNWLVGLLVTAQRLPRLDFSAGIPADSRTIVVVPTMLSDADTIKDLLEGLEVRYLANRDDNLHFALLTDFNDAQQETLPGDAELVRLTREGVTALNRKYEGRRGDVFLLFHRRRRWNPREGAWMGHERKRGKLAALNSLLRGGIEGDFSEVVGDAGQLSGVRYVITLDTDTQLPRDAAREMVGAMAHTLNRPVLDARKRRVVDGYGIMQPRVSVSLTSARRSWFVRLFAGEPGVDPYTRVVSDVYQDLFGEGSFVGKGIYDVDVFEATCRSFPENTILSHDLLEGSHARSALMSDVELYEAYPSRYLVDTSRRHRWMRGDWQIARWLLPRVPRLGGGRAPNPIAAVSWWKILDNLRRSLVPIAALALLFASFLLLAPREVVAVMLFVVVAFGAVPALSLLADLARKPSYLPLWTHLRAVAGAAATQAARLLFTLAFLSYDAYVSFDAIARTATRVLLTRRHLLEWTTASEAQQSSRTGLPRFLGAMLVAPALTLETVAFIQLDRPTSLLPAAPFLGLWFASPVIAWWLSRTLAPQAIRLSRAQHRFLRKLGRKTWRYFESFVTAQENWLPPDNVQELATLTVAARTSPTNIGVALLANLSAADFGYCSVANLLERTRDTLAALLRMERYRGHFFNWYDTRTLAALHPHYVSTVDSGNLVGHLLVVRSGLLELCDTPPQTARAFDGIQDTLEVLRDGARARPRAAGAAREALESPALTGLLRSFEDLLAGRPRGVTAAATLLSRLVAVASEIAAAAGAGSDEERKWWARALARGCQDQRNDLSWLAPWVDVPALARGPRRGVSAERLAQLDRLHALLAAIEAGSTPRDLAAFPETMIPTLDRTVAQLRLAPAGPGDDPAALLAWWDAFKAALTLAAARAAERVETIGKLTAECRELTEVDYAFLFDKSRDLFAIGYNVDDRRLDGSFYDLLASEARLGSFVAIAQGKVNQEHWFALGRILTKTGGAAALLSWSGSMFEYLMPMLVMPSYENTLLERTCKAVVRRQIDYGNQRAVPWGISESGYNTVDPHLNYQYRAFGVPGLGLKRGLSEDLVIAPYAAALALMVEPEAACRNLERLAAGGYEGSYGFYEAIDYTPSRLPPGASQAIVRQFMAHHQGMSLLSLAYLLLGRPMQRRFEADPMLRADDLLLQERVPKAGAPLYPNVAEAGEIRSAGPTDEGTMRVLTDPGGATPEVTLLSNGRFHTLVTHAGGGYSRWRDLQVTRWREDPTRDCWGSFCYLRDLDSGALWSTAWQPTLAYTTRYQAVFTQARAEFHRRDVRIDTRTEISVSPEDDIELRRVTLTNRSESVRTIEVTSYAEVALAPQAQDLAHPAFSNLFVQTELVRSRQAIICTRRPRSAGERPPWMVHLMTVQGTKNGDPSFETDRMKFIGRGRTLAAPAAMEGREPLSDSHGPVLDPVVCIRQVIVLQPNETAKVDIVTGVGETREIVTAMMDKYHDPHLADRVFELAWTHSHILLQQINATEANAQSYARLAGPVIFAWDAHRSKANVLARNRRGQSGLWGYGISGDLPIVLLRMSDRAKIELCRQAIQAHAYWRIKGIAVDLVIWNEDDSVYRQTLQDAIMDLIAAGPEAALVDRPGGIFVRRAEAISDEDRTLLLTVARVVLLDDAGTFAEQAERRGRVDVSTPPLRPTRRRVESTAIAEAPPRDLAFFNGLGGFSRDGREYLTLLRPGQVTPAPWVNVIANPQFGTVVSESGSSYTWSENSHEFRLTPWANDPVADQGGEAIYIRDEQSGYFWSPSPSPARGDTAYIARHGFGYSIFEHQQDGIVTELCIFVATDEPVKFARVRISNRSGRPRKLSLTGYWEWVLGELRDKTLLHVVTELDATTGALFARNAYNSEFGGRVAFVDCSETVRTVTADRLEFFGRNGTLADPAALHKVRLSGHVGAGLDPCAAIAAQIDLADGQEKDVVFTLGAARDEGQARQLVQRFRGAARAQGTLEGVWGYWGRILGTVHYETPDPALNFLANGWLLYQVLSARIWGRTGFYQSGGAYGFRDQLQDAMAVIHAEPAVLREHLLRASARQFQEGDVQHWWHPPAGRGVRTHCSDDYLWLPFAACRYVAATGDTGVLEERTPFLLGRAVRPEEESYYDLPQRSEETGTLYEHCVRAIDNGLRFGAHGLPLMGCGDWNDGMNLVGAEGRGESVWLAFFLFDVLTQFAALARRRDDDAVADRYTAEAAKLRANIEAHGWDGQWYRRAYFDDGQPLGSASNPECQIDTLPQSWSVLSGAGPHADPRDRAVIAMLSAERFLVRYDERLIQVLEPPFDKSALDPGYIKGYVPGVRENGGQYTHAAVWTAMAFAEMGDTKRAWDLFRLINPVSHATTPEEVARYRVEPYVAAADVYAVAPHTGRGGWTWYTGSAGWMYRLISESLLGLRLEVDARGLPRLRLLPCLPGDWSGFKIHYRYRNTPYHLQVRNGGGGTTVSRVVTDGREQPDGLIWLVDDRQDHQVEVDVV
jgi:cellobiose phosphorylase